jgi:hypothetical protein
VIEVNRRSLRLLEIKKPQDDRYATVTTSGDGCWSVSTTTENIQARLQELFYHHLSIDIQDALRITWYLGICYLWVRKLCIIEDDPMDEWKTDVLECYRNATVNIVVGNHGRKTSCLVDRIPPWFSRIRLNNSEELYVGWLSTEAYCDPRGLNVERFPDAWRYLTPSHLYPWIKPELHSACRNLFFQADFGFHGDYGFSPKPSTGS